MSRKARIVVLGGDGIGPEVTAEAVRVLEAVAQRFKHEFQFESHLIGGAAIDATGSALPAETVSACGTADAVLLGAVGGPKWSDPNAKVRPEQGLLAIRKALKSVREFTAGHGAARSHRQRADQTRDSCAAPTSSSCAS